MMRDPETLTAPNAAALVSAVAERRHEIVALTQALVAEQSTLGHEQGVQRIVEDRLASTGYAVSHVVPDPEAALADPGAGYPFGSYDGRWSVVGRLAGTGGGRSLHLSGHVDVVPVDHPESWRHAPWAGELSDGRIYGRGAGDMKGGVAAYLVAAAAVAEICPERRGELIFSTVIEEECGGNGMWSVLRAGHVGDAVLIGESTEGRFAHAATGVVWCRLVAPGGTGHAALATGEGPFESLARAIASLRVEEDEINTNVRDPDFAAVRARPYGMSVGRIEGGVWVASTPLALTAWVRFGFGPETLPEEIQVRLRTAVAAAAPEVEVHFEGFRARAHNHPKEGPLLDVLGSAHHAVTGTAVQPLVNTATTDARYVETVPGYCYGPVGGNPHGTDEWVDVDSLVQVATVVALTAAAWTA
jgi:acetylornithine deacetylase